MPSPTPAPKKKIVSPPAIKTSTDSHPATSPPVIKKPKPGSSEGNVWAENGGAAGGGLKNSDTSSHSSAESATPKPVVTTAKASGSEGSAATPAAETLWPSEPPEPKWQQDEILKVEITDLSNSGDGVGRWEDRVVFVPNTVPGDIMRVKMTKVKATHGFGIPAGIVKPSPDRVRPSCIVADKCGGCQWQQVSYTKQLAAKRSLVVDALERIGKFKIRGLDEEGTEGVQLDAVMGADQPLGYRNKATYPLGVSQMKAVQAGYYRKGSHRLVNLNQCPVQDESLNPLLAGVKLDIQERGWKIYDERLHKGHIKHLSLRVGQRTGQVLLTLISRSVKLKGIHEQAQQWMTQYPNVVGVLVNLNWKRTNAIFGPDTYCIAGQSYLEEEFSGLKFQIQPSTFFQVNTPQAEKLLTHIEDELALTGEETLVDAYCGVGTFTLPLARKVKQCIGLEAFIESVKQAEENAALNSIENVSFKVGDVAESMPQLEVTPDIILLDPPRKGCEPAVLESMMAIAPQRIVYVSCNPATLARDLKTLCETGAYKIRRIQPADFFPQTSHVECAAFLEKAS